MPDSYGDDYDEALIQEINTQGYYGHPDATGRQPWIFTHPLHPNNQKKEPESEPEETRAQMPKTAQKDEGRTQARKLTTGGQTADVVDLATARDKRQSSLQHSLATRGQKSLRKNQPRVVKSKPYIEPVKASKGTWAFRLRWRENGKRQPPVYLSRVSDVVYDLIRGGDYEAFKQQLIASHNASAIRASHGA